jgi:hypothetical protein
MFADQSTNMATQTRLLMGLDCAQFGADRGQSAANVGKTRVENLWRKKERLQLFFCFL